jgi:hypothetical protein
MMRTVREGQVLLAFAAEGQAAAAHVNAAAPPRKARRGIGNEGKFEGIVLSPNRF